MAGKSSTRASSAQVRAHRPSRCPQYPPSSFVSVRPRRMLCTFDEFEVSDTAISTTMSFFGLRKWPTPARTLPSFRSVSNANRQRRRSRYRSLSPCGHSLLQGASRTTSLERLRKPEFDVRDCATSGCDLNLCSSIAEEFKNDPRNPYREQIAKEGAHH